MKSFRKSDLCFKICPICINSISPSIQNHFRLKDKVKGTGSTLLPETTENKNKTPKTNFELPNENKSDTF